MRRSLAKTINKLTREYASGRAHAQPSRSLLKAIAGFGDNPGQLTMLTYAPPHLPPKAPLVVVLHGCTQSAESYAQGAGWIDAAARYGFMLLCPEQQQRNNPNLCFNWFVPQDISRESGEAASIAQMIKHETDAQDLDREKIFITGLSAGGAMANVMLATYPELFRAGAIIAGLPFGSAQNVREAFAAMSHQRDASDHVLGARVRAAAAGRTNGWPAISVWHGDRDATVSPAAGEAIVRQWSNVHDAVPAQAAIGSRTGHRAWQSRTGAIVVEHHAIRGMGHGTPLKTKGTGAVGSAGPYLLDVGISSTLEILASWGISPVPMEQAMMPADEPIVASSRPSTERSPSTVNVSAIINNALRAAGLLK